MVNGNSMNPLFKKGDKLFVKKVENYEIGDIVAYYTNGYLIIHRIIDFVYDEDKFFGYILKGDSCCYSDGKIYHGRIMGKTTKIIRDNIEIDLLQLNTIINKKISFNKFKNLTLLDYKKKTFILKKIYFKISNYYNIIKIKSILRRKSF